jgi:hypothetical protein
MQKAMDREKIGEEDRACRVVIVLPPSLASIKLGWIARQTYRVYRRFSRVVCSLRQ